MKVRENKAGEGSQSPANGIFKNETDAESLSPFRDNIPTGIAQGKMREIADRDPRAKTLKAFQEMADNSQQVKRFTQLKAMAVDIRGAQKPLVSDKERPVQLLSKTIDIGNEETAEIEYNLGSSVEETNTHDLGENLFQEMADFSCIASLDVTLSADMEAALEFGFIANVMSSRREAFYNSTKKTKLIATIAGQTLDGDGEAPPFAIAPVESPTTAGKHSLKVPYADKPLLAFPRKDPNAEDEGNTLIRVSGIDKHKVWFVVGNPSQQGITVINNIVWEVSWDAEIDNESGTATVEGGGGLLSAEEGAPVMDGELVNDSVVMSEETWA